MLFSFARQILAFPALANFSDSDFALVTFTVFLLEAVAYGFTGAIPDYFTKNSVGGVVNKELFCGLRRSVLLSLFVFPVFLVSGVEFFTAIILTLYLYFFSLNALYVKLHFNLLDFKENYYYIGTRLAPYLLLYAYALVGERLFDSSQLLLALTLIMLLFEFGYSVRIKANNNIVGDGDVFRVLRDIWPFMFGCLLFGLVQRGDMVIISKVNEVFYIEYAKNIILINFFCNPVVLMISNPLLSFLSKNDIKASSKNILKMFFFAIPASFVVALFAAVVFGFIYEYMYKVETVFSFFMVFVLVCFTILYNFIKTLCVKYVSSGMLVKGNLTTIFASVSSVFFLDIVDAVFVFYVLRCFVLLCCIFCERSNCGRAMSTG
jgi:hypothetical protein